MAARVGVVRIAHNAHYLECSTVLHLGETEMRSNRIFARFEKFAHKRLVHYRDVSCRRGVLLSNAAAAHNQLTHGFKVARAHTVPRRHDAIVGYVRLRLSLAYDNLTPVIGERSIECERRAFDSRNPLKALAQRAVSSIQFFRRVAGKGCIDVENDTMVGLESEVLVLHFLQASRQQSSSC